MTVYESIFDAVEGLPTASENTLAQRETVIVPVDPDGVTVTLYEVALLATNPLTTPLIAETSASIRSALDSEIVISTDIAPVIVGVARDERRAVGRVTSSTQVSVIPDATTCAWIPPE